ncbi:MAG: pantoate--beta-alanine ligase [Chloroflexota bacterium]
MLLFDTAAAMRAARETVAQGERVALAPTLGGLHAGHRALLRAARGQCDTLVASVFLNPTQFGDDEDLTAYPADREADLAVLEEEGVDVAFAPTAEEMYPENTGVQVDPGPLGKVLEGASRPGHFRGVATVVAKLFSVIRPHAAFFGEKDAQQLRLIRRLNTELLFGIQIVPVATVRELDGLALSSRNRYLTLEEREAAPVLYNALWAAQREWDAGERDPERLARAMRAIVNAEPRARLDYAEIVDPESMGELQEVSGPALAVIAAWIGRARLIDNIMLR